MLTVIGLAGCGSGHQSTTGAPPEVATSGTSAARSGPPPPPRGGLAELRSALTGELRQAGSTSGGYVYDLTGGAPVFALREGIGLPPASVEKLYTSVSLLTHFNPQTRLHTTVLGRGHLDADGTWHGDLYLRGGGDPTFGAAGFNRRWEGTEGATISGLVANLKAAGIRRVTGAVVGDGSLFDGARGGPSTGYAPDLLDLGGQLGGLTYNHGTAGALAPDGFAAKQLMVALRGAHVPVGAGAIAGVTPPGTRRLASVASPPLSELLRLMNVPSDDFFAETLLKLLGARFGDAGSISAGARVTTGDVATYGIHPTIIDGSGLSRANRSSPIEVVDLLRGVWSTPVGDVLSASLPLVGVNGTVRRIAVGTPAQGRCVAKTGTLNGVTNLAGYCHGAGDKMLAFALFLDGPSNERGIGLLSRMVADIVHLDVSRP
jgi:D-alanyl-D-alanine carboxypeptidase/D-alanyl-D-alanine-endopeptidase (penicillin-binding protein 4)